MANEFADRIREQLFREERGQVYAVLDGARDRSIHARVLASGQRYVCLYAGALPRRLAQVAPYLVRLWRDHPFTDELLHDGWGKSWGIFVAAHADLEEMRRHLRRFLRVETEDGKKLVFRYYDPRVLRVYLPTCTEEELRTFFGPVSAYMFEDRNAAALDVYGNDLSVTRFAFEIGRVPPPPGALHTGAHA